MLDRAGGDDLDDRVEATALALRAAAIEGQMPITGDDRVGEAAPRHCSGAKPWRSGAGKEGARELHGAGPSGSRVSYRLRDLCDAGCRSRSTMSLIPSSRPHVATLYGLARG
jgi:hypothetical protein